MRVTPLDIIQKQFNPARRGGLEADDVREFLEAVRESMEELLQENQRLREQISRRDAEIEGLRSTEADIKDTLMLARKLSEDVSRSARRESEVIVGEARLEAERILAAITEERRELQAEVVQLKSSRAKLLVDLRAAVDLCGRTLQDLDGDGQAVR